MKVSIFLVELTPRISIELYTVKEALEGLAARLAVQNIDDRILMALQSSKGLPVGECQKSQSREARSSKCHGLARGYLRKMKKNLDEQSRVVQKRNLVGYSRLDFGFHAMVYEACGNTILQELLETIKSKMRPIAMHIDPGLVQLYDEHFDIFDALKKRDPQKAEYAFWVHNRHIIEPIKASLENNKWGSVHGGKENVMPVARARGSAPKA